MPMTYGRPLFGFGLKRRQVKPTAAMFVDFEHWCYSLDRIYGMRPKVKEQYDEIAERFDIKKIFFFGDFSNPKLQSEISGIREITDSIIDTQNPSPVIKKDFTDFIMLDYIYQEVDDNPNISTYILFTGDGHFSSVVRYLQLKKKKKVVVYGIRGAVSNKFRAVASECIEIPREDQEREYFYKLILENFNHISSKNDKKIFPTFNSTVKAVSSYFSVAENNVRTALQELMDKGIIYKASDRADTGNLVRVLRVDWNKAEESGLMSTKNRALQKTEQQNY